VKEKRFVLQVESMQADEKKKKMFNNKLNKKQLKKRERERKKELRAKCSINFMYAC
jgi:hypothetical protein